MAKLKLDKEEKDLLDSYERGEWKSVQNLKEEIKKHRGYARQTLKKTSVSISGFHPWYLMSFKQGLLKMVCLIKL